MQQLQDVWYLVYYPLASRYDYFSSGGKISPRVPITGSGGEDAYSEGVSREMGGAVFLPEG